MREPTRERQDDFSGGVDVLSDDFNAAPNTLRRAENWMLTQRGAHRIRPLAAARVAQGGDVVDIDAEAQRGNS